MAAKKLNSNDELERIKKTISDAYMYFKENYNRYHEFRKYVFRESVTEEQRSMLRSLHRPIVEFNILEAYISRLLGEFSMHEPGIEVSPNEGAPVPQQVIDIVEGHIRHTLHEANKESFSYEVYKDLLAGGFSVGKVYTDYSNSMSFNQKIFLKRAFDPTLCGFDPMARASHKGDGRFCFEIYPMTHEDFEQTYPKAKYIQPSYIRDMDGFNWSYKDAQENNIVLVCDYYEKKKKRTKIVKMANGRVITMKNYEKLEKYWEEQQFIEQIPAIVGNPRWTELETICRYRISEKEILEYTETDYTYLPLIFIDGHSIVLTQGMTNNSYQMTRPYVYHARGIQDLKNFAGQSLANYLENMIQHKFIIKKEALPQEEDYLDALNDIQRANTVVVNAFSENDPNQAIPEPIREVVNVAAPPEVMGAFQITDPTTQTILGSFASNLGRNDQDLSGKAVIESSTVGNAAAMPYVVGYLAGLTQIANIIVDLMPKYLVGQRVIPILSKQGEKGYQAINNPEGVRLDYDEKAIHVNVEAGVNFQVQKNQAMDQITRLMQASSEFNQFMNSPQGLPILVKNLTIYGADELKEAVPQWIEEQQKQQQQNMQMQQQIMQESPQMVRAKADAMRAEATAQKSMQDAQNRDVETQIQIAKVAIEKELADAKIMEAQARISQAEIDSAVRLEEANTSIEIHALDSATKLAELHAREHRQKLEMHDAMLKEAKFNREREND